MKEVINLFNDLLVLALDAVDRFLAYVEKF